MFSGKYDRIVNVEVNREYAGKIPAVIEHNELEADHLSFLTGSDMSFLDRTLELLDEYHPLHDKALKETGWHQELLDQIALKNQTEEKLSFLF